LQVSVVSRCRRARRRRPTTLTHTRPTPLFSTPPLPLKQAQVLQRLPLPLGPARLYRADGRPDGNGRRRRQRLGHAAAAEGRT
jgi:hypothetical protein